MTKTWDDGVNVAYITNGASLTITVIEQDGACSNFTISKENTSFEAAKTALTDKNIDALLSAVRPIHAVEKVVATFGEVRIENDNVWYGDNILHGVIVDRILEFAREGFDYAPLVAFLDNLLQNPSKTAIDELYKFMESSTTPMPITEDGYFLAYKKVRSDFKDLYSGTVDYSVGSIPEMKRSDVNDNRQVTCADGLHFCALSYLEHYWGGNYPVVIVKINPADVVSIPYDYNNAKGRACKMEVIGVHKKSQTESAWDKGYSTTESNRTPVDTPAEIDYFYSRQGARRHCNYNGGRVVDFQKQPWLNTTNNPNRWAVFN